MPKDSKVLIGIILITLVVIVGGVVLLAKNPSDDAAPSVLQEVLGLEINPESYDLGEVTIDGGIVSREFEVKNTSGKTLKLKKVATSCMCTEAKVIAGDKETKFFGMEGHGDRNPVINLEIPDGMSARVIVNFDPAAHGPQGTGPFERIVWLTFSDPGGIKELKFNGTVIGN